MRLLREPNIFIRFNPSLPHKTKHPLHVEKESNSNKMPIEEIAKAKLLAAKAGEPAGKLVETTSVKKVGNVLVFSSDTNTKKCRNFS